MDDHHVDDRVAQLLADSRAALARGDLASAQAFANAVLALRPGFVEAREVLAELPTDDGERRQLTVMFCDVVGSTPLSERNDPEVVRSVLRSYRDVLDDVVTRVEGSIAAWVGDGALVYFGHPVPHEDDAWRAVHAGLALLEGLGPVAAAADREHGIDLAVRVAVHTGLVIRAEMGTPSAPDRDAIVGPTPNMAARLQDKARPGSMLITGATYALVSRRFEVVPVGPFELRGIEGRVGAFEVVAELPEPPAVETLADGSAFVGRLAELQELVRHWEEVEAGGSAAVAIVGDPGIGKSRLAAELRRRVEDVGGRSLLTSCSSFHRSTPMFPVRRVVEAAADIAPGSPPREVLDRLHASLAAIGHDAAVPIVAELLGVADEVGVAPLDLDPQRRREVTLAALVDWVAAEARRAPLLLVVDDLQWADPTTADLVDRIVSRRSPGVCLIMTVRAGHPLPWSRSRVGVIELEPLGDAEVRALVAELADTIEGDVMTSVVRRADGVPLFVEELVNATRTPEGLRHPDLPSALRDPLLSRLAAAGDDLGLAQLVATIGDDVDLGLLTAITGRDRAELEAGLKALVAVGLLDGGAGAGTYRFHHNLMAELAYDTQLHAALTARHDAVAEAILRGDGATAQASLGRHLEHAGRPAEAIEAYVDQARDAQRGGSHPEAIAMLDHAVELLVRVSDEAKRTRLELLTLECRGFTTTSMLGLGAPQAATDYQRCLELLRHVPDIVEHQFTMVSVYSYFSAHGDLEIATDLNDRYRESLERVDRDVVEADSGRCLLSFLRGDFRAALAESQAFSDSPLGQPDAPIAVGYPLPNEPVCSVRGVLAASQIITLDLAGAMATQAVVRDRAAGLPFPYGPHSSVSGQSMAALGWGFLGDEERTREVWSDVRALAQRHGILAFELVANVGDALVTCLFGEPGTSGHAAVMIEVWKATGVLMFVPCYGATLAKARLREGDHAGAIAAADENLEFAAQTGMHCVDSPLLRLRGEARLASGDAGGELDVSSAAELAATQGALLFELQARLSSAGRSTDPGVRRALADLVDRVPGDPLFPDLEAARLCLTDAT